MAESWVFDRGTFPVLRWACSRRVTTYVVQLFGDRSFATAGPRAWNKLPSHLRLMLSAVILKHFLFHQAFFTMPLLGALVVLLHLSSSSIGACR